MTANLRTKCTKFVSGHPPQKAGEEFSLIGRWCRENDFAADVYGSGDLISSFEEKVAKLLGLEAACFMPSGTMAQQIALKVHAEKTGGDAFAIHPTSHLELHEQHAYAHLSDLKSVFIGDKTRPIAARDVTDLAVPVSTINLELPAREIGGQLPAWKELEAIKQAAAKKSVRLHMDGARLWETKSFYQKSYQAICRGFDSVYVSFYKGIGALTGAMLLGEKEFIAQSRVWLRRFGGNLFQMHPYVASAAMRFDRALEQMPEYARRAREVYQILKRVPGISFCPAPPEVNMFHLYFNAPAEKLKQARDEIAEQDKIWIANNFQTTALADLSLTEIYVGEGLLQIEDDELLKVFAKLIELAGRQK